MSRTFAVNVGASPTVVFSNKWTWPTQVGTPLLKPDVWGGLKGLLRVPFTKPWVYTGKNAILADYAFKNRTLANGGFWTSIFSQPYYLDSAYISTYPKPGTSEHVPSFPFPQRCADSAITFPSVAAVNAYSYAHGARSGTISLRSKLEFFHYSYYTAPDAPVVHALGPGGNRTGAHIGARCNPLYLDLNKPVILLAFMTSLQGESGLMGWAVPWNERLASRSLWLQAAWLDSQTKAFSLTTAVRHTLPDGLPPAELPRYSTLYWHDTTSTTGSGPIRSNGFYFPYTQYRKK